MLHQYRRSVICPCRLYSAMQDENWQWKIFSGFSQPHIVDEFWTQIAITIEKSANADVCESAIEVVANTSHFHSYLKFLFSLMKILSFSFSPVHQTLPATLTAPMYMNIYNSRYAFIPKKMKQYLAKISGCVQCGDAYAAHRLVCRRVFATHTHTHGAYGAAIRPYRRWQHGVGRYATRKPVICVFVDKTICWEIENSLSSAWYLLLLTFVNNFRE